MISKIKTITITLGVLLSTQIFASGSHNKMDHSKMKMKQGSRKMLMGAQKKEVLAVLQANEKLQESFFKYDGASAQKAAMNVKMAMSKVSKPEIAKLLKYAQTKLGELKSSNSRDQNNKIYHMVSSAMILVVKRYDVGGKYNAYSCPMAKKKWIQNSAKNDGVKNPYLAMMPGCGSKDTTY